jgi:hypothetical protein
MIVKTALSMIDPETKKHITFLGLGGEEMVGWGDGIEHAVNIVESHDYVPNILGRISFWNRGPRPAVFDGSKEESGGTGHSWRDVYLPYLEKPAGSTRTLPRCAVPVPVRKNN